MAVIIGRSTPTEAGVDENSVWLCILLSAQKLYARLYRRRDPEQHCAIFVWTVVFSVLTVVAGGGMVLALASYGGKR